MNRIKDIDIDNKNIVLRLDLNVPIVDGVLEDNSKIVKAIPTIQELLNHNCRVVILSHLGRVKKEEDKAKNTLKPVAKELADLLERPVKFIDHCYGDKVKSIVDSTGKKEVILLENTRFMDIPEKKESGNDLELAKYWASLGEVFINDAFGSLHRAHASTAGIAKFLPHAVGLLVEKELINLHGLIENTPHPFTVFMGGAKVDDKLKIISKLLPKCDALLLSGGIANSFLKAKGADVGNSVATDDPAILDQLRNLMQEYKSKIVLPVDFTMDEGSIFDIGPKSIELFKRYIDASEIIFVNGTCGKFEDQRFQEGTEMFFSALKTNGQRVIVGGGDTVAAVKKFGFENDFKFLSSGGGATLEYIADGKLEALEWMK